MYFSYQTKVYLSCLSHFHPIFKMGSTVYPDHIFLYYLASVPWVHNIYWDISILTLEDMTLIIPNFLSSYVFLCIFTTYFLSLESPFVDQILDTHSLFQFYFLFLTSKTHTRNVPI